MTTLLAVLAAASIFGTSVEDLRKEFPHARSDDAIVADAVTREVMFEAVGSLGEKSIRESVIPIVVHFADRRCVVLEWPAGTIGGGPGIYCYQNDWVVLVSTYHDRGQ